jgi:hypothetical protein
MKKISRTKFGKFRNDEHFQCLTELKNLFEQNEPLTLKLGTLYDKFLSAYGDEDSCIKKIEKNTFTDDRYAADQLRDSSFRGLSYTVNAALNHYNPEMHAFAKRIAIPFNTYGNIAKLPLNEETSSIYNLVQELRANFAAEISALELAPWIDKLEAGNIRYEKLVKTSLDEAAVKTDLKAREARIKADRIIVLIFDCIESFIVLEGEEEYSDVVKKLNLIIEKYDNTLAQRQGIYKSQKSELIDADTAKKPSKE